MKKIVQHFLFFCALVLFAALGRYLLVSIGLQPFPNFEVVTVAAFIGMMLLDVRVALFIPLVAMVCSDILIGNLIFVGEKMNQIVMFTYSGFTLVALGGMSIGRTVKPYVSSIKISSVFCIAGTGALLVFLYDVWTNFGWWYLMYPHTGDSLATVYVLGVPFMIYHLISGVVTFVCVGLPAISYFSTKQPRAASNRSTREIWRRGVPVGVVVFLLVLVSLTGCVSTSVKEQGALGETIHNASMEIIAPGWNVVYRNVTTMNMTVASFLFECADHYDFSVKSNYWQGYKSLFVEEINGIKNGAEGSYWQYYVNGEYANTGCSNYYLKDNDVVSWRFESPEWGT
ncbi:MAG: DUF4430 domain-containing protein [Candidatus Thermoplasmatota archaeon]|nr:DUF4430 domain-containing protein [Candidatus Thermoplasmatota archaeon]